jgi:hypothetical protein
MYNQRQEKITMLGILNSALLAWGLVGLLMVMLAVLAFLRNRSLVKERLGILIIVAVLLVALIALTVRIE